MPKLKLEPVHFSDHRFGLFLKESGYTQAQAVGTLVLFWFETRKRDRAELDLYDLNAALPCSDKLRKKLRLALMHAGYISLDATQKVYCVLDNVDFFRAHRASVASGRRGGHARARAPVSSPATAKTAKRATARTPKPKVAPALPVTELPQQKPQRVAKKTPAKTPAQEANAEAWGAYRAAFLDKWQVEPLPNAKNRAHIATIVQRVGREHAPGLLTFFVHHTDRYYVSRQHDLGLAMRDCHSLFTQFQRGQAITSHDVSEFDGQQRLFAQMQRLGGHV